MGIFLRFLYVLSLCVFLFILFGDESRTLLREAARTPGVAIGLFLATLPFFVFGIMLFISPLEDPENGSVELRADWDKWDK